MVDNGHNPPLPPRRSGNLGPAYDAGVGFPALFALFFPCFTGFLSGADRAAPGRGGGSITPPPMDDWGDVL